MATEGIKQRFSSAMGTNVSSDDASKDPRAKRVALAKRGLRTLVIAVALPVILTVLSYYLSGGATSAKQQIRGTGKRGFWYPPAWALYAVSASCAGLTGLSAWMVWTDGGFHRRSDALGAYLAQLFLGLLWGPVALALGSGWAALAVSGALAAALFMCAKIFGQVNPVAADLVKPCFAWAVFLAIFSYKLM